MPPIESSGIVHAELTAVAVATIVVVVCICFFMILWEFSDTK